MSQTRYAIFFSIFALQLLAAPVNAFAEENREKTLKSFEDESLKLSSISKGQSCSDYRPALEALRREAKLKEDHKRIFSWHPPDYAYVYYKLNGEYLGSPHFGYILCLEKQFIDKKLDSIEIQDACPICTLTLAKNFIKIRINPTVGKEWLPKKTRPFLLADWAWMRKASEIVEQQTFPSGLDSLLVWMESSASINPSCGYMSPYQDYKCLERWRPEIKRLVLQIQPTLPKDDPNFFRFVSYYRKNGKNQAFKDSLVTLRNKMKNELSLQKILKAQGRLTITP